MARTATGTFTSVGKSASGRGKLFGSPGVRLDGDEELAKKLKQLEARLAPDQVGAALKVGGEVIRATAEALAPRAIGGATRSSGHGADHVVLEVITDQGDGAAVWIGASKNAFWLNIQETGTLHAPAQPWLIPAFDEERQHALRLTEQAMRDTLLFGFI